MALLRLTALALAACSAAGADPGAPPHRSPERPAGWQALPEIAAAVRAAAAGDGVTIDAVDAWGEPARGCYAVWLELHGAGGAAPALADQVLDSVVGLSPTDVVKPSDSTGVLAFGFARPPYRGQVRAQLGHGRINAVACFASAREPVHCHAACARVLHGVP